MKRWQNKTTPLRRRTIKEHWKKISSDPRDNPRQFFGTFVTSKGKNDKVDISLDIQGKVQQDQQLVAVEFTNYFSTVADNIEGSKVANLADVESENHSSVKVIGSRYTPKSLWSKPIDRKDVVSAIQIIDPHKAAGHDVIPPGILKLVSEELASPLTKIFNQVIKDRE